MLTDNEQFVPHTEVVKVQPAQIFPSCQDV